VRKAVSDVIGQVCEADYVTVPVEKIDVRDLAEIQRKIRAVRKQMLDAAARYDYEAAAELRDRMFELEQLELELR
jgi:excinuclease UvrABC helicase subunit UvrB